VTVALRSVRSRVVVVAALALASAFALLLAKPIPQSQSYHAFADARALAGVPNFGNVASNVPFAITGALAAWRAPSWWARLDTKAERWIWAVFFAGVFLTAFGSSYYHLAPSHDRLFWDRMPMAVAFMALFAAQLGERVHPRLTSMLGAPLVVLGLGSVLYWNLTERAGTGDLRPYIFVQAFPILSLPVMLGFFPARYTRAGDLWAILGLYAMAKVLEATDAPIYGLTGGAVSGHSLKHLAAGAATYVVLRMLSRRRLIDADLNRPAE
jgi:hypothetical protein